MNIPKTRGLGGQIKENLLKDTYLDIIIILKVNFVPLTKEYLLII